MHITSKFTAAPRTIHYVVVLHIIQYLKGTLHYGLLFSSQLSSTLRAYADADWASDVNDKWFTNGLSIFIGNSLISLSKKQDFVSRSTTKAEYWVLAYTIMPSRSPIMMLLNTFTLISLYSWSYSSTDHFDTPSSFGTINFFTKVHATPRFRDLISKLKMLRLWRTSWNWGHVNRYQLASTCTNIADLHSSQARVAHKQIQLASIHPKHMQHMHKYSRPPFILIHTMYSPINMYMMACIPTVIYEWQKDLFSQLQFFFLLSLSEDADSEKCGSDGIEES